MGLYETVRRRPQSNHAALSAEQLTALQNFARSRGRTWKSKLGHAWETGAYGFADDSASLQQVRNQFGPNWLQNLRLPGL